MTFREQTRAIQTRAMWNSASCSNSASRAAMRVTELNRSLLPGDGHVNENDVAACGNNPSASLESIPVGKIRRTVVILSDMAKQVADELPEAGHAFREWRREEVS